MEVIIYSKEDNAERLEVGRASKVRLSNDANLGPTMLNMGTHIEPMNGPLSIHVDLYDWKTPLPPVSMPRPFAGTTGLGVVSQKQYDEMLLALTCVVNMMGGAVTISGSEFESAYRNLVIEAHEQRDPQLFIITTKEK